MDVKDRTNSGLWVGGVLVVAWMPTLLVGLTLGPLIDRLERRKLMVGADIVRAAVFAALPFTTRPWEIVALAAVAGLASGFFRPAVYAGVPNLVPPDELPVANALLQTMENLSWAIGPILGGVLTAAAGPHAAYWINAVSFVVSASLIVRIPRQLLQSEAALSRGHWRDLKDGFAAVRRSRPLLGVLFAWGVASFGVGAANVSEVFLAKNTFHAGDFGYGLLFGAIGTGLAFGSFSSSAALARFGVARAYAASLGCHGARLRSRRGQPERVGRGGVLRRRRRRQRRRRGVQLPPRAAGDDRRHARPRAHARDERDARAHRRRLRDRRRGPPSDGRALDLGRSGDGVRPRGNRRLRPRTRGAVPRRRRARALESAAVAGRRDWTRETLAAGVREGDRRALARAITLVENGDPLAYGVVADLYPATGNAYAIGITGPPGVGKSSLISSLVRHVRAAGSTVGVVSVDPSSPFSKGALLGDRIRLSDHFLDPGVFIRSMGTRGHLGGLAEATLQALLVLDAAGKDLVFLETVGAGQSEVEVIGIADTVVLVLMPGSGDSVQALKAGIMEIPDVIAINKMDHPAAKTMLNEVRSILALDRESEWRPPIVLTEATRGENVPELWEKIESHRSYLVDSGQLDDRRRRNLAGEVFAVASARAKRHLEAVVADDPELRRLLDEVQRRELDPLSAVEAILDRVFHIPSSNGDSPRTS